MNVSDVIRDRRSVRAFLDRPIEQHVIADILTHAKWSPSGGNLQPWKVIVVTEKAKQRVSSLALETLKKKPKGEDEEYPIYPKPLPEPYRKRQFEIGKQLYGLMGIERDDKAGRQKFIVDNLNFFGAPVGLFFIIDRSMQRGQWAHLGMLMQSIALIAHEQGYGTCMQEVWALVRKTLHSHFQLEQDQVIYCGMSLGYIDTQAKVNSLKPSRISLDEFVTFLY